MKNNHFHLTTTARAIRHARSLVIAGAMLPLIGIAGSAWAQASKPAGAAPAPAAATATAPAAAVVNPEAIDALKAMSAYLRTLKSFTVRAESSTDEVMESGQKIQFANTVELHAKLPDRLRVSVSSDRKQREIYYDGKTVTQYAPRLKYYGSVAAPGTIRETLKAAAQKFDLDLPLADLFYWGSDQTGIDNIKSALFVGPSHVGGVACDHYAFRQDGVDWQLWIQSGKSPLPCKLVITTLEDPAQPQYAAVLHWDLKTPVADASFTFVPPKGAQKIVIAAAPK
jgi:hypothetical protein